VTEAAGAMIREAFITHAGASYLRLSEVLVRGLAHFSSRPVVVYGVGTEVDYAAPNLIKRTLDERPGEIYSVKFRILAECGVERGVYLDADQVPNRGIDELFAAAGRAEDHPLAPRHPQELGHLQCELMAELGVARQTMPFVHSCCLAFSGRCADFFTECHRVSEEASRRHPAGAPVLDEPLLNVMLWRRGATRQLDCCNIAFRFAGLYLDGSYAADPDFLRHYAGHPFRFHTFHYCKDPAAAARLLAALVEAHRGGGPPPAAMGYTQPSARD
jgi:hypothetical protein